MNKPPYISFRLKDDFSPTVKKVVDNMLKGYPVSEDLQHIHKKNDKVQ